MQRLIASIAFTVLLFAASAAAQTPDTANLLRTLLDLPAPPPAPRAETIEIKPARYEEFYDDKNPPPDDAPLEDVRDYWEAKGRASYSYNLKPPSVSVINAEKLLREVEREPETITRFLAILPDKLATAEIVNRIYLQLNQRENSKDAAKQVKEWLKFNSTFFTNELLQSAEQTGDRVITDLLEERNELTALARHDWERAKPLVERLAADPNHSRITVFAQRLLYENALAAGDDARADDYRARLEAIVADRSASDGERDTAFDALIENKEWQGFDDWYLALFADETLLELKTTQHEHSSPLENLVKKKPDKWIPLIIKFVSGENRAAHNAAVQALAQFSNTNARRDALEPLLPWLSNPSWAEDTGDDRQRLIQSVDEVDLPESVTGLIWAVENDEENGKYAAESLIKYKDARAIPALKNALLKTLNENDRDYFIRALIACDGLTDAEMAADVEVYAAAVVNPETAKQIEDHGEYDDENPLPLEISIGKVLSKPSEPPEGYLRLLFRRINSLQKSKPAVAAKLLEFTRQWSGKAVDVEFLERIRDNRADVDTILMMLARREYLRETAAPELSWLTNAKNGTARAAGAAIYADETTMSNIIARDDAEAKTAMLAFARLLRFKLPVRAVGIMLGDKNKLLALAAERYLESEDSREARALILARHKGEALILGARDSFNPVRQSADDSTSPLGQVFQSVNSYLSTQTYELLDAFSDKVRKELLENPDLLEVYIHQNNDEYSQKVVRIYRDRATFTVYEDSARYREKILTKKDLNRFRALMAEIERDEIVPNGVFFCVHACGSAEFVSLTRGGGRRIFSSGGFGFFAGIDFLTLRFDAKNPTLRYWLENKIKGLEILSADSRLQIKAVWKRGADFRVLVADRELEDRIEAEIQKQDSFDSENAVVTDDERSRRRQRLRNERINEHLSWRKFENGELGEAVAEPSEIPFLQNRIRFPADADLLSNENPWQIRAGDVEIRAGNTNKGGLWQVSRDTQKQIREGDYQNPVTTPDAKWTIAAKAVESWDAPNAVVRVNVETGKEYEINLPPADNFFPLAFVAAHNRILLYRAKDENSAKDNPSPAQPEYYLLDAETGKTESVTGEFQPFWRQAYRPLEPTVAPNEFWTAITDHAKNETNIGIYDTKTFAFKSRLKIPDILLNTMFVWVDDAAGGKIYFTYGDDFGRDSHLLALPLPKE